MAECTYHQGTEAVGSCVNCGKMICGECRVVLDEKYYCQPCANEIFGSKKIKASPTGFVISSVILAILSLFLFPPVFGIGSIVLGYFAYRRNHTAGIITIIIGLTCMIIGIILSAILWSLFGAFI